MPKESGVPLQPPPQSSKPRESPLPTPPQAKQTRIPADRRSEPAAAVASYAAASVGCDDGGGVDYTISMSGKQPGRSNRSL